MNWALGGAEYWMPDRIFDMAKHHRLVPEMPPDYLVKHFQAVSAGSTIYRFYDGPEVVATVLVSGLIPGYRCDLDLIPVTKHFDRGYEETWRMAAAPLIDGLFSQHGLHRISAQIPESRSKTRAALRMLGFMQEGRAREAIRFRPSGYRQSSEAEDVILMGLLAQDWMAKQKAVLQEAHESA